MIRTLLLLSMSCVDPKDVGDDTDLPDTDPVDTDTTDTDTTDTDSPADTDPVDTDLPRGAWCDVQAIFDANCSNCHGSAALGGLNLADEPYAVIVGVPSVLDPTWQRVVPGQPDQSLLYRMLQGTQTVGRQMPYGASLADDEIAIVQGWIADGAQDDCGAPDPDVPASRHHPEGYFEASAHGHDAKYQAEVCVDCHGADLTGAPGIASCDLCHAPGWREDCTFCHGDPAEGSGAPPVHISGQNDGAAASFIPHLAHVQQTEIKRALDCVECHVKPADILSAGHLFLGDSTPGVAEVDFTAGISSAGQWAGNGTCSNLWCHGTGRADNGRVQHDVSISGCGDCHPAPNGGLVQWARMSGEHSEHLGEGLRCWECHGATVDDRNDIIGFAEHVNGAADVQLRQGMTYNNGRCSGSCHQEGHNNRSW